MHQEEKQYLWFIQYSKFCQCTLAPMEPPPLVRATWKGRPWGVRPIKCEYNLLI